MLPDVTVNLYTKGKVTGNRREANAQRFLNLTSILTLTDPTTN